MSESQLLWGTYGINLPRKRNARVQFYRGVLLLLSAALLTLWVAALLGPLSTVGNDGQCSHSGLGESLVSPYTRGSVTLARYLTRGARRKPGASSNTLTSVSPLLASDVASTIHQSLRHGIGRVADTGAAPPVCGANMETAVVEEARGHPSLSIPTRAG
jgi:hypothetical protein